MDRSKKIIESWHANAQNWIETINNSEIESRVLATNDAIVKAVIEHKPKKVLDIGCGEGWLVRELRNRGMEAYGVDAVPELISNAIKKDGNWYYDYSYSQIVSKQNDLPSPFDAIVFNFSIIDEKDSEELIGHLPALLKNTGVLIIQTLHPLTIVINNAYTTGWKDGSWNGMKREFSLPYEWYFRTLGDWIKLFSKSGFELKELREPLHPNTNKPLSIIFILRSKPLML